MIQLDLVYTAVGGRRAVLSRAFENERAGKLPDG